MASERFEHYIQVLYNSISHLLSGDLDNRIDVILKIIRECEEEGVCDKYVVSRMLRLADVLERYVREQVAREVLLDTLREEIAGGPLRDLAILILREICDEEVAESLRDWAEDPNPDLRLAYLKCVSKLFDEGMVSLDQLRIFRDDPSPKVREALVTSLSKSASRDDVFSFLAGMLGIEKRSSIRTKILMALSKGDRRKRSRGGGILERLRRAMGGRG